MTAKSFIICLSLALATGALSACGGGNGSSSNPPPPPPPPITAGLHGTVLGGQQPVSGATVQLWKTGNTGYGTGAASVGSASSDTDGQWTIPFTCSAGDDNLYYLSATGGDAGSGTNGAIALVSALGTCSGFPDSANINELTTAATVYALVQFMNNGTGIGAPGSNEANLSRAFATVARLANSGSGKTGSAWPTGCDASPAPTNCDSLRRFDSLANSLAACINSAGAASSTCMELFDCATAGASYDGSASCMAGTPGDVPTDTLQAALSVARHPGTVAVAGIYDAATRDVVFAPALATAPTDWTLSLTYTDVGLSEPTDLAIDADGNVWIANYNNRVVELAPSGSALSPAAGYTGGGLQESFGLAIDADGHVWVTNEQTPGFNNGDGSVTELASDGSILSGTHGYAGGGVNFPMSVAIDASGNVWLANTGKSSVSELTSAGLAVSPSTGYTGGGIGYPIDLAFDPAGDLWIANQALNAVSELSPAGVPLSPDGGYTGGGLDVPQGVAVDGVQGNVWVSNYYGDSITELDSTGTPVSASAYTGGGLSGPGGIAVDGSGTVWIANYRNSTLSALQGPAGTTPGAPVSPDSGFTADALLKPYTLAIDGAGNIWVSNFGNDSVTEFIGLAAPVQTPRIGPPQTP